MSDSSQPDDARVVEETATKRSSFGTIEEDAIERIVAILEDDAFRRGGTITHDRLLALAAKQHLTPEAIIAVRHRLATREIAIESTEPEDDDTPALSVGIPDQDAEPDSAQEPPDEVRDLLASYYRDAKKFKQLRSEEEVALARRVATGRAAAERLPSADAESRVELEELARDGNRARQQLVEANLRLVPFVAKSFESHGALSEEDLIQEGNLGLLRAAEKFDGAHGTRFSTYACWWIWSCMKRGLIDRGRLVRLPVHVADRVPTLLKKRAALRRENDGRDPTPQELAEHLGWRIEMVQFVLQGLDAPMSLDTRSDESMPSLGERLTAPAEARPDIAAARSEVRDVVIALVDSLGERLAFVLTARFGLDGGDPMTLEDIGQQLGVTRERVRQLEKKAFDQLRHPSRSRLLAEISGFRNAQASWPEEDEADANSDGDALERSEA
jgi:RNA polymerase sigma factor (sigma-70 family)